MSTEIEQHLQLFASEIASMRRELARIAVALAGKQKPLLTIAEVAEITGRSAYTVRRWIADRRLHATRVTGTGPRGRLLVARAELEQMLTPQVAAN